MINFTNFMSFRIWCKSLGEKVGSDKEADKVCLLRTLYWLAMFVTCFFIIGNTVRHW